MIGAGAAPVDSLRLSDGALTVTNRTLFDVLAQRDMAPGSIGLLEIKFIIMDAASDHPVLYFMNSKKHEYHYTFARDILGYRDGYEHFVDETYFSDRFRKNLAGSIIAYDHAEISDGETGLYTLEFWPSDPVSFQFVKARLSNWLTRRCLLWRGGSIITRAVSRSAG